jgi:hypothetical protein
MLKVFLKFVFVFFDHLKVVKLSIYTEKIAVFKFKLLCLPGLTRLGFGLTESLLHYFSRLNDDDIGLLLPNNSISVVVVIVVV